MQTLLEQGEEVDRELLGLKYELSPSAITDYVTYLGKEYGARLIARKEGRRKFWRLVQEADIRTTDLTRAASLKFGEITLDVFRGTKYHREVQRLSRSERSRLALEPAHRLDRLARGLFRRTRGSPDYSHRKEALEAWLDAILTNRVLWMRYQRADGRINEYTIEPLILVLYHERLHLLSRLAESKDARTFDLDGVLEAILTESEFVPPPPEDFDPREIYRHSFGIFSNTGDDPQSVRLAVRNVPRVQLELRPAHPSQVLGDSDEHGWRDVTFTLCVCPEFRSWVLSLLPDVRVLEPPALVRRIRDAIAAGQANNSS
ncbi:MAG: helix-turn-helix transcriptional regulator [Myxococcota bacterium]